MTDIATISVEVTADSKAFDAALRRIEASAAKVKPVTLDVDTGSLAKGERAALSFAQARARLAAQGGDLAGAERIIAGALRGTTTSTVQTVNAQTKLLAIQQKIAAGAKGGGVGALFGDVRGVASNIDGLIGTVAGLGGAFAAVQVASAGLDFARTGASIDAAKQSFDNLAASAGTSGSALLSALNQTAQGTVAQTDLIKSSNTALLLLGSDVASKLPQLLAVAKASATTLGTDVGQVFDSLVTGISRGSTELIDNAGITIKAAEAYASYAESIGKSADSLSSAEKQQAILNAVLTSGEQIIAQTSGGGATAATSFQQMDAAAKNLTATLQVAAASGLAPLASGIANTANVVNAGIGALTTYGTKLDEINGKLLAGGGGYEEYRARVESVNQQIRDGYGIFGVFAGQVEALTPAGFALRDSLVAQGVGAEQANAQALAYDATLGTIRETLLKAANSSGAVQAGYQAVGGAAIEALSANAALEPQINAIVTAFNAGSVGAAEAAAQIAALAAEQNVAAVASQNLATSDLARAAAATDAAAASREAAAAGNQSAIAALEQAAAAEQAAQQQAALEQAIRNAAAGSSDAEAAAQAIAAKFNGVEAPAVANLISLYRGLANAKSNAASAKATSAASADQRAGERNLERTGDLATGRAREVERLQSQALRFEQDLARSSARSSGGGGGGGGGARSKTTANPQEKQQQALYDKLQGIQERFQDSATTAERTYQERILDISREFAEKRAAAEQSFANAQVDSKASFYTGLASVDKGQRTGMIQEFEAAQAKAAEIASTNGADAGEAYLSQITSVIRERAQRQADIAKALEAGDKEEASFLQGVDAIARAAEQRKLDQAAAGKDTLAGQEQAALGDAAATRDDALAKAQLTAQNGLVDAEGRKAEAARLTNEQLAAQLSLVQQIAAKGGATPAAAAPAVQPAAATTPAATATTTPAGAVVVASAPSVEALLSQLSSGIDALRRAMQAQPAYRPGA